MSKFIFVQGFNASGTSAIWDILKEANDVLVFPGEFHYYKMSEGIAQLKYDLFEKYTTFVERDYAVRSFIKAFNKYNYIQFKNFRSPFENNSILNKLNQLVIDYVNSIKINEFYGHSFFNLLYKSNPMIYIYIIKRYIQIRLLKHKWPNNNADKYNIYTYEEIRFNAKTRTFIIGLIQTISGQLMDEYDYTMLSHFFSNINHLDKINEVLGYHKMIVIYRDPRDVFTTFLYRGNSWSGVSEKNSIEENMTNFKVYYKNNNINNLKKISENTLIIKFEELIQNYKFERARLFKFLDLSDMCSDSFFFPDISLKNIGIYQDIQSDYKELFDYLTKEYPEHCNM